MGRRRVEFINPQPHFFQPLLQDFLTNFSVPESFLKYLINVPELKRNDMKKIAFLKVRRQETYWKVELCTGDNGRVVYYFRDGWHKFCKHHGLQIGDFLVFQHKGHLVFDVSIFDPSSCQSQYLSSSSMLKFPTPVDHTRNASSLHGKPGLTKIRRHKADRPPLIRPTFKPRGYPYFQMWVKKYWCRSGVMIPSKFARENGIIKKSSGKVVIVVDTKGKSWKLSLTHCSSRRYAYIGKWCSFHRANSLEPNLPVVFELISTTKNRPIFNFYKLC